MKAAQVSKYGGPSVISITEIEVPKPAPGQVLVKVEASSINPFDTKLRSGVFSERISVQFPFTLGGDIAGTVESLGESVTRLGIGDKVYGQANVVAGNSGAFAEFAVTKSDQLAKMPANVDFTQAASLSLVGITVLQGLTELVKLVPGQKVIVLGGSGGTGTIAIELAKSAGTYVVATTSDKNLKSVKAIGADEAIDYKNEQAMAKLRDFDVLFNATGGDVTSAFRCLKKGGTAVSLSGPGDESVARDLSLTTVGVSSQVNTARLNTLTGLIENGIVTPQIAKVFPLDQIVEAFEFKEQSGHIGKIAITM